MRKLSRLLVFAAVLCAVTVLWACGDPIPEERLSTPVGLTVNASNVLIWDAVPSARGYKVEINGTERTERDAAAAYYSLSSLPPAIYELRVKAVGDGKIFADSNWSRSLSHTQDVETGLSYRLINNDMEYEVSGTGSASGVVETGEFYKGKPVTRIGERAFANRNTLTGILIGSRVTSISARAFSSCLNLASITIPDNVDQIGAYAFQRCLSLTSAVIGNGVTSIDIYAFNSCRELTDLTISNRLTSIDEGVFSGCNALTDLEIPDSVTNIGRNAFRDCVALTELNIGGNVATIGLDAFTSCTGLTKLTIGGRVATIDSYAFYNCYSLYDITIGENVTSIGRGVFLNTKLWDDTPDTSAASIVYADKWAVGCKDKLISAVNLKNETLGIANYAFSDIVTLGAVSSPGNSLKFIGNRAFLNCINLNTIAIPDSVVYVDDYAFHNTKLWNDSAGPIVYVGNWVIGCKDETVTNVTLDIKTVGIANLAFYRCGSLATINLQNTAVRSIGNQAFRKCVALTNVTLPASVTSIGRSAFYECTDLTSINIPAGVTVIQDYTFFKCESLVSIVIPNGVISIGRSAFYMCLSLTSITIPNSVTSIGEYVLAYCVNLKTVRLPDKLASISAYLLFNCYSLTDIIIPDNVTIINDYAFYQCFRMKSVTFGSGLKTIGNSAFRLCDGIADIIIPDGVTSIGNYAFYNGIGLKSLTLGAGLTSIGNYAFSNCLAADKPAEGEDVVYTFELIIPNSLTSIGNYAFYGCTNLKSVTIESSLTYIGRHAFNGCDGLTIYCEPGGIPQTWSSLWNSSSRPVLWGCVISEENGGVMSFTKTKTSILNPNAPNGISAPSRKGYNFEGWTLVDGGTFVNYTAADVNTAPDDTVLYVIWTKN